MTMTLGRKVLLVAALALLPMATGCDQVVTPEPAAPAVTEAEPAPAAPVAPVAVPETDPVKATEKRVADLVALKAALDAYHAEKAAYPAAYDGLKGFVDRGAAWIPELTPKHIAALPRDPVLSDSVNGPQYLYVSDTKGYKLIAQSGNAGYCAPDVERQGIKIDPARTNESGCWAYGFWTEDFVNF